MASDLARFNQLPRRYHHRRFQPDTEHLLVDEGGEVIHSAVPIPVPVGIRHSTNESGARFNGLYRPRMESTALW